MSDYIHSGSNKMNKVEAYKNENKLLLADKLGHAKVSSLKEQNLLNTIATVQQHSTKITQLETDANKVRGAYVYKGTVETEFDLPLNNNSVGDVYNTSSTGMNYAWNGENWDELGGESNNTSNYELTSVSNVYPTVPTMVQPGLKLSDNNGNDSFVAIDSSAQLNLGGTFVPELTITQTTIGMGPGMPTVPAIIINLSDELSAKLNIMQSDINLLKTNAGIN